MAADRVVRILLPTHLFPPKLVPERSSMCVLVEDPGYFKGPTNDFRIHLGRLAFVRSACAAYSAANNVRRVPLESSAAWLREASKKSGEYKSLTFVVWDPLDNSVADRLRKALGKRLRIDPDHPGFAIGDPAGYIGALSLKSVLEHCKNRLGILSGVSSKDSENRSPPDAAMAETVATADRARARVSGGGDIKRASGGRRCPHAAAAAAWAAETFPGNPGDVGAAKYFPHTRAKALVSLRTFLREALPSFGPYQDAVLSGERRVSERETNAAGTDSRVPSSGGFGVHSGLAAAMNIGLVHPVECARAAVAELQAGRAPLQSVEAYVRQLLGWREYSRMLYERHGTELEKGPFAGYPRLPGPWYDPNGPLLPIANAVRRANATAYLDHISRLMIANNVGILHGAHPGGLLRWFTELVAADAHQWAMVANIAHMGGMEVSAERSGGGDAPSEKRRLSRRAYVSSSAYIRRMTDLPPGDWEDKMDAAFYAYVASGAPGSEYYRATLSGKRYRERKTYWKALAVRAKADMS